MNPFTRSLLDQIDDDHLVSWVTKWDSLEALIIEIYRASRVGNQQADEFLRLQEELLADYESWRAPLEPHWRGRQAGGRGIREDPYLKLLAVEEPAEYVDNWDFMQLLPAAREAINSYLLAHLDQNGAGDG